MHLGLLIFNTMREGIVRHEKPPVSMYNFHLLLRGWKHPWGSFGAVGPTARTKDVETALEVSRPHWKEAARRGPRLGISWTSNQVTTAQGSEAPHAPVHPVSSRSSDRDPRPSVVGFNRCVRKPRTICKANPGRWQNISEQRERGLHHGETCLRLPCRPQSARSFVLIPVRPLRTE